MNKIVAILQSNYIPWKGYFDLIHSVDEFILYDEAQYTTGDWRNRNQIKTPNGLLWLTIPVIVKGCHHQTISQSKIAERRWKEKHLRSIMQNYRKAQGFDENISWLEKTYGSIDSDNLSEVNLHFIESINRKLGIETKISQCIDYELIPGKTERLVAICQQAKANCYLSGPSAKAYINEDKFLDAGIELKWMDYLGYPEYPQIYPPFVHGVSIIDLILNNGAEASRFMKTFPVFP